MKKKVHNKVNNTAPSPRFITEADGLQVDWYEEAKGQTLGTLPAFLNKLVSKYRHDYGTICHAIAAAAIGAACSIDHSEEGGITGFQASAVMWEFMKQWQLIDGPAKLVKFENMLYPQYESNFDKTIPQSTFDWLVNEAKTKLADKESVASEAVIEHWESIASDKIPFGYTIKK